jgi:O-antigen/teichoic acid export membrane protein
MVSKKPLKTSFAINLFSPLIRVAIAFVTTPIYLHTVGDARFGVITIVWTLLGLFGFMDLGLSRAATNALSRLRDAPQAERARVLLTTMALNFGFGMIGGLLLLFVGEFMIGRFITLPDELARELATALPWMACLLPMTLVSASAGGALESRERFFLVNCIQVASVSLSQIAPVIVAVAYSPSLAVVIPATAIAQATSVVAMLIIVNRLEGPFSLRALDRKEGRTLLGYGGWMAITNLMYPALASADQFIIGSVAGVAAVAHYAVPMSLVLRSNAIPVAFGRTFFPRMSNLSGDAAYALATRALSTMGYGFAMVCAPAIILSPTLFRYWIGPDFALSAAPVAQILFFGIWVSAVAFVAFTLLQSQGRADLTGKLHLVEALPFLAIVWILTLRFGINGAAIGWSLRAALDSCALFWMAGLKRADVLTALAPPTALLLASAAAAHFFGASLGPAFISACVAGLIALGLSYAFCEDWRLVLQRTLARGWRFGGGLIVSLRRTQAIKTGPLE